MWLDRNGERISSPRNCRSTSTHLVGAAGLTDPDGTCCVQYGLEPGGAVLVRPDGFVGWRASDAELASAETVTRALATLLGNAHVRDKGDGR
ncbi:MAG: hypothetical protein ABJA98_06385 [Acidobacteriota bacterium]